MPKYTFLDFAEEVLTGSPKPVTFQEIWQRGKESGASSKLSISGKTPWATLGARLFVDIRDNPKTKFIKVGRNPARFFLRARKDELSPQDYDPVPKPDDGVHPGAFPFHERHLHPLVAYAAYTNTSLNRGRQVFTKTIFHERSRHTSLSEWVHPDLVGFYAPLQDWKKELVAFNKATQKGIVRLFSFEVKKQIHRGNYRESFFQAVSNSSWANEGYLVAADVQQHDDLMAELERLSASFGIGIFVLDLDDIDASSVLFPAREKDNLDWELMNKLCDQNSDFVQFVENVQKDLEIERISPSLYDPIPQDLEGYVRKLRPTSRGA